MDYRKYRLSFNEKLKVWVFSIGFAGVTAYLFFNHWLAMLMVPFFYFVLKKRKAAECLEKQQNELASQFQDGLQVISNALLAGYSLENAFLEAEKEMQQQHGAHSMIVLELHQMNQSAAFNQPIEELVESFALRTGNEDIICFGEVLAYAKRSGGNFVKMIEATTNRMREKLEIEQEITVLVASKKLEQKVMNFMPLFILGFLRVSSADYLSVLYQSLGGHLFMLLCLGVYALAMLLSEQITKIRI